MEELISDRAKALLKDPLAQGQFFTWLHAAEILGIAPAELFKDGRTDLDQKTYADLGFMASQIGPPESAVKEMRARCTPENIGPYPPDLLSPLREAAAAVKFHRKLGADFNVIGVAGAQGGIGFTYLAFLNPGDEVIVTDPGYFYFIPALIAPGAVPVPIRLCKENGYRYDPDEIRAKITPQTKMIVVCDPINPFGTIQTQQELIEIAEIARENKMIVFNNITHCTHQLDTAVKHHPMASLQDECNMDHVISTSGLSKGYGMAAERLGFLAGHPRLLQAAAVMEKQITKMQTVLIAQYGALAAIRDKAYVHNAETTIRRNLDHLRETVEMTENCTFPVEPQYGFACVIDTSAAGVTAQELCIALFKRKVAVCPGDGLGDIGAWEYTRLNLSRPDIWAYERLRDALPKAIAEAEKGVYAQPVIRFFEQLPLNLRGKKIISKIKQRALSG